MKWRGVGRLVGAVIVVVDELKGVLEEEKVARPTPTLISCWGTVVVVVVVVELDVKLILFVVDDDDGNFVCYICVGLR